MLKIMKMPRLNVSEPINSVIDEQNGIKFLDKTSDNVEVLEVNPEKLLEAATYLKMNKDTQFNVLLSVSGADKPRHFELVYHLYSTVFSKKLIIKAVINKNCPEIESLSGVYSAANWHERETYDLLGINFLNHPALERILLPRDWKGHPLRKDYVNNDERLSWNER